MPANAIISTNRGIMMDQSKRSLPVRDDRDIDMKRSKGRISAPAIMKRPWAQISSSDYEFIRIKDQEFKRAWEANRTEFSRLFQAWKLVFAAPGEQWDEKAYRYKTERDQRVAQYNLVQPKIDKYTGSLMRHYYNFRYNPVDGVRNTGIQAVENAYYCDSEMCEYVPNWNMFLMDMVIHQGILEIKKSKEYNRLGNIVFERQVPGDWVLDPYHKVDDDRKLRLGYKHSMMTIDDMFAQFKTLPETPQLQQIFRDRERIGSNWTPRNIDTMNTSEPLMEDAYHVVERHWIEDVEAERLMGYDKDGNPLAFPVTEDYDQLDAFAQAHGVTDWKTADTFKYWDKVHKSAAWCVDLFPFDIIEMGKPEMQVRSLPIITGTLHKDISGRNKGLAQDLIDPQKDVNYNKSKVSEYLANALGGAIVYDKTAIPSETDQQNFEKSHNDPTKSFPIDGDPTRFSSRIRDHGPNEKIVQEIGNSIDFMDRISEVSAAMESEGPSGQSGKLFEAKLAVNELGHEPILERVKRAIIRQKEMYYEQQRISYSGSERRFTSRDGKHDAILNERVGNGMIRNKVDDLQAVTVTLEEARTNMTRMTRTRRELSTILEAAEKLGLREPALIAMEELFKTTNVSDEMLEKIEESMSIAKVSARAQQIAEIMNMEATGSQAQLMTAQSKAQLQQLMQNMGGQARPGAGPEQIEEMISQDTEDGGDLPESISPEVPEGEGLGEGDPQLEPGQQPEQAPI